MFDPSSNLIAHTMLSKKIDKNNKRLKGSNAFLTSRRDLFERVRTLWDSKIGTWCSLDFEAWEYEHGLITECGYSYVRWEDSVEVKQQAHFRLNTSYRNGKFVPDHSQVEPYLATNF
jgi:hypothetical protein